MRDKIVAALAARYKISVATVNQHFDDEGIEAFGKLRQTFSEAGETMTAAGVASTTAEDSRDASYIRVSTCLFVTLNRALNLE